MLAASKVSGKQQKQQPTLEEILHTAMYPKNPKTAKPAQEPEPEPAENLTPYELLRRDNIATNKHRLESLVSQTVLEPDKVVASTVARKFKALENEVLRDRILEVSRKPTPKLLMTAKVLLSSIEPAFMEVPPDFSKSDKTKLTNLVNKMLAAKFREDPALKKVFDDAVTAQDALASKPSAEEKAVVKPRRGSRKTVGQHHGSEMKELAAVARGRLLQDVQDGARKVSATKDNKTSLLHFQNDPTDPENVARFAMTDTLYGDKVSTPHLSKMVEIGKTIVLVDVPEWKGERLGHIIGRDDCARDPLNRSGVIFFIDFCVFHRHEFDCHYLDIAALRSYNMKVIVGAYVDDAYNVCALGKGAHVEALDSIRQAESSKTMDETTRSDRFMAVLPSMAEDLFVKHAYSTSDECLEAVGGIHTPDKVLGQTSCDVGLHVVVQDPVDNYYWPCVVSDIKETSKGVAHTLTFFDGYISATGVRKASLQIELQLDPLDVRVFAMKSQVVPDAKPPVNTSTAEATAAAAETPTNTSPTTTPTAGNFPAAPTALNASTQPCTPTSAPGDSIDMTMTSPRAVQPAPAAQAWGAGGAQAARPRQPSLGVHTTKGVFSLHEWLPTNHVEGYLEAVGDVTQCLSVDLEELIHSLNSKEGNCRSILTHMGRVLVEHGYATIPVCDNQHWRLLCFEYLSKPASPTIRVHVYDSRWGEDMPTLVRLLVSLEEVGFFANAAVAAFHVEVRDMERRHQHDGYQCGVWVAIIGDLWIQWTKQPGEERPTWIQWVDTRYENDQHGDFQSPAAISYRVHMQAVLLAASTRVGCNDAIPLELEEDSKTPGGLTMTPTNPPPAMAMPPPEAEEFEEASDLTSSPSNTSEAALPDDEEAALRKKRLSFSAQLVPTQDPDWTLTPPTKRKRAGDGCRQLRPPSYQRPNASSTINSRPHLKRACNSRPNDLNIKRLRGHQ